MPANSSLERAVWLLEEELYILDIIPEKNTMTTVVAVLVIISYAKIQQNPSHELFCAFNTSFISEFNCKLLCSENL